MVFSSMTFLGLFLPAVMLLYRFMPGIRLKNGLLLIFSLLFYAWGEPVCIVIMLLTVLVNYISARMVAYSRHKGDRKLYMILGVGLSLGFLFLFKYLGFFSDVVTGLLGVENPLPKPALPIGISFYTFQVITYTVDVYRGKVPVQKSYWTLLLYVSFFPQLIAGPIVNYTDIAASLESRSVKRSDIFYGLQRFLIGFMKKVLLANTCGVITDKLHAAGELSVAGSWLLIFAYGLQIYFDFSGYSDMAIGMGRMFGFRFLENFNYPYISKSITEFWRRWHISLGSFFREYVYIPLGGNRVSTGKHIRNILIVWLLTGFWHGASWNFLAWGGYYGALLLLEKFVLKDVLKKLPGVVSHTVTLLLVMLGWVLFYYESLGDGLAHMATMFGLTGAKLTDPYTIYYFKHYFFFLLASVLSCLPWNELINRLPGQAQATVKKARLYVKPMVVTALFLFALCMIIGQSYNPFLYFRF